MKPKPEQSGSSGFTSKADWQIANTALYKNTEKTWHHQSVIYIWAEVRFPTGNPIFKSNPHKGSALLNHGASRGGVQFFLNETETWTQFKCVPKFWGKAGSHEKEVPQAGPGGAVLLEKESQLKRGHHGGIVHDALELLAAIVQLQVDVENGAAQAAGLARRQPQDLTGYPPR